MNSIQPPLPVHRAMADQDQDFESHVLLHLTSDLACVLLEVSHSISFCGDLGVRDKKLHRSGRLIPFQYLLAVTELNLVRIENMTRGT